MLKRAFSFLMLSMFLISTVAVAFNIQRASASDTIIDTHGDSRFTKYPIGGAYWWSRSDSGTYNGNFWYTYCGDAAHGGDLYWGKWDPPYGQYEVFVWIPNPTTFPSYVPTHSANYDIYHSGGLTEIAVNQALRLGGWYGLGSYTFASGSMINLDDRTGEPYVSTMVAFDAIKFVSVDVNKPPYVPSYLSPSNHETGVAVTRDLSWSGGDPDGDVVTYDVYFGLSSSPPLVSSGQSSTTYNPSLSYVTTYYWKIVSRDEHGASTPGSVWDFATEPPPTGKTLNVYSSPSGVAFTANGVSRSTPWSGTYSQGTSVSLVMSSPHSNGDARYYWEEWDDGAGSLSRTIVLNSDTTLTGIYDGPYYELVVDSSPVSGIPFTVDDFPETTTYAKWLYQGYYTVEMPASCGEYVWQHWHDDDTSRTRTVLLSTSTYLTAVYSTPEQPHANFGYSPGDPSVNRAIVFDATYATPEGQIRSYAWIFDDGLADSGIKVTHSFCDAKTHSVSLTVTDDYGRTDTRTVEIPVRLYEDPAMGPAAEKKLEYANMDASRRKVMYDIIKQALNVEQIRAQRDLQPEALTFSYLNVLLRQLDQNQQDIYMNEIDAIREYALSENEALYVGLAGGVAGNLFVALGMSPFPFLGEAAKRLGFFIGEQLVLSDIWSATVTYPGTGRMEVFYRLSASKVIVNAYLEEPINRNVYIIIPVKLEPVRTSWGPNCPLCTGIRLNPEYTIREIIPILDGVTIVSGFSPVELRVSDLQGRVTGLEDGVVRVEIPESGYVDDTIVIFSTNSSYLYQLLGKHAATYGLFIIFVEDGNATDFSAVDIPTSFNTMHQYMIDWSALSLGNEGVTVEVDSDGNGVSEYTFTSDSELTQNEFLIQTGQSALYTFSILWGAETFTVSVESNSTVSEFAFSQPDKEISFNVSGEAGTIGFCNVTIPRALLYGGPWIVLIDGGLALSTVVTENATHSCLYFTYAHSTHTIQIVGSTVIGPPTLSVSISPLSASILVGDSVTFTSIATGGVTPYSYQWYLNDAPVLGATSDSWTYVPTAGGVYSVYLAVTDSGENLVQSQSTRVTVGTIPGDLNYDGVIDIRDIVIVAAIYGSETGDPEWNPEADLSAPYGKIEIRDLVTVAAHYGERAP